jgi:tetratricopeptide (TPR) repeat protein
MKTHTLLALICLSLFTPSLFSQTTSPIPEEARKHFVMGTTLFKDAKTADDYAQVESQFKQAVDLAPQWPEARYNLALAKEAAGDYSGAMADLKLYQKFKLSDADARTVQDKIYAIEAKAGAAAKKQADEQNAAAAEEHKNQDYQDKIGFLAGSWNASITWFNGENQHFEAVVTITGKTVLIANQKSGDQLLKGMIEGDDYPPIKWIYHSNDPHMRNNPDCPIDVTVNKFAHQINWKDPGSDTSTSPWTWIRNAGADIKLTK